MNARTDSTFLIVTHDINTAQTVPDNIGLLYRRHLAMFGPREVLLTSDEPVVARFLNGRRQGPIGMSEEKDTEQAEREMAEMAGELPGLPPLKPQWEASPGLPRRKAVDRGQTRVREMLHTLPENAQKVIRDSVAHSRSRTHTATGHQAGGTRLWRWRRPSWGSSASLWPLRSPWSAHAW